MNHSVTELRPDDFRPPEELKSLGAKALVVGVIGAAASAGGAVLDPARFYPAYLVGWLLWFTVGAGCLGLLMLHHLSGGRWGIVLRRQMEAGARTIPILAVFSVPLFLGLDRLYLWTDRAKVEGDHLLHYKAFYLNSTAFTFRFVLIAVLFTFYAFLLSKKSAAQDAEGDVGKAMSMQRISSVGLLLFVLAMSFVGFDWLMSLDPYWFSSLYGAIFLAGSAIAALTFMVLISTYLVKREPMAEVYTGKRFHDWGTLLFAFVMFFTYLAVSQFIIAYQGNLPEEVSWFRDRFDHGWGYLGGALLVLHFFFPFLILLNRPIKRRPATLAPVAAFVLAMRWLDLYWNSRPTFAHEALGLSWIDLAAAAGVGGLFVYFFVRELGRRPLLPAHDPTLPGALGHE